MDVSYFLYTIIWLYSQLLPFIRDYNLKFAKRKQNEVVIIYKRKYKLIFYIYVSIIYLIIGYSFLHFTLFAIAYFKF